MCNVNPTCLARTGDIQMSFEVNQLQSDALPTELRSAMSFRPNGLNCTFSCWVAPLGENVPKKLSASLSQDPGSFAPD